MKLEVISGDVTQTAADALLTLVNSRGKWYGGVDYAIMRVAGEHYHSQLRHVKDQSGLSDGQVVVAPGTRRQHTGQFDNVIFVVDELQSPLKVLVYKALEMALTQGYKRISMPLFRSGAAIGLFEATLEEVVEQMKLGFIRAANFDLEVTVVIYNDPEAVAKLNAQL